MKKYLYLLVSVFMLLLLFVGSHASALSVCDFETTELSNETKHKIWNNINVNVIAYEKPLDDMALPIVGFDVSADGIFLIGFKDNKVALVDQNKNVLKLFKFSNEGSFYVNWSDDNNILLLLVRGSIIVEMSPDLELISINKVSDNSLTNNSLWNEISGKTHVEFDECSYYIKNKSVILKIFSSSYSQLIKTDSEGNSTVIYDISKIQTPKTVFCIIAIVIFVAVVILIIKQKYQSGH